MNKRNRMKLLRRLVRTGVFVALGASMGPLSAGAAADKLAISPLDAQLLLKNSVVNRRANRLIAAATSVMAMSLSLHGADAAWRSWIEQGGRLIGAGRYPEAAEVFRMAAADAQAAGNASGAAASLDQLGVLYDILGREREAERSYRQAVAILEACPGGCSRELSAAYRDFSGLYVRRGQYGRARTLATRALALLGDAPQDKAAVAELLMKLATIDSLEHRTNDAEARLRSALAMFDEVVGRQSVEWISTANNLAALLFETGRPDEAEAYLREAVSDGEVALRSGSGRLAFSKILLNAGQREFQLRRFEEAETHISRALEILERDLGPAHRLTGECLMRYASLCRATKRKAEAKTYERRARACLAAGGAASASAENAIDFRSLRARAR